MNEYEHKFQTLSALVEFFLKKAKEISKDRKIMTDAQNGDEIRFATNLLQLHLEATSMLYGLCLSMRYGDVVKGDHDFVEMVARNSAMIRKQYREFGDYKEEIDRMYEERSNHGN